MHRTEICKMDAEARKEGASQNVGCIFGSKLPSLDGNITMKAMILDTQLHITMYVAKCYSSNLSDMEKRGYWILQEHEPCKLCLTLSNWGEKSDPKHFWWVQWLKQAFRFQICFCSPTFNQLQLSFLPPTFKINGSFRFYKNLAQPLVKEGTCSPANISRPH